MFRHGIRRFSAKAAEAVAVAESENPYGVRVSRAQGVVKGLTGGTPKSQE
jgi:cysteine synthase A